MRPVSNPPNPYRSHEVEWLGPPPEARLEVFEEPAKSILSKNDSPDIPFTWSVNPYRGCQHACAYCYARPEHQYLGFGAGTDFETRIVVKTNAAELLAQAFTRPSWRGEMIAFSGDTDCYQPLEASYRLTRACLEVCRDHRNPVGIITKSPLVRRDIDVLQPLAEHARSHVVLSIAFHDTALSKALEPGTPAPLHRIAAVRALTDAGIPCGILFGPVIPGLNDGEIPDVLAAAKDAGARSAAMILLRLPGPVEGVFLERLREALPDRYERVVARLRDCRQGELHDGRFHRRHEGEGIYWKAIRDLFDLHRRKLGLDRDLPPTEPTTFRKRGPEQLELF